MTNQTTLILVNFGGRVRNVRHWVVRPDGTCRDPDEPDSGLWRFVRAEELALSWAKPYRAAPHEFAVGKLPVGGCTAAQLGVVARLETEIEAEWKGVTGASGRTTSPPIGKGWGLAPPPAPATPATESPVADTGSQADMAAKLAELQAKFGKRR